MSTWAGPDGPSASNDIQPTQDGGPDLGRSPRIVVISYRLGGADGVSKESAKWARAMRSLGCRVSTVAGEGEADHLVPGLAAAPHLRGGPAVPVDEAHLHRAISGADLVVVENLCSLPLNPSAGAAVAKALRGRPAVLHHHDLPWQRPQFAGSPPPPDDPAWRHVTITDQARSELAVRGLRAVTVRNCFDPFPPVGEREVTRRALGVAEGELLFMQPTRAIRRKGIARAVALAEAFGATYWLVGDPEEGYGEELTALLANARTRVVRGRPEGLVTTTTGIENAYAAADLVLFPSTQEGFGNPPVEASLHLRPVAVGPYPARAELEALGFRWPDAYNLAEVGAWLAGGHSHDLELNAATARRHLSTDDLPLRLGAVLRDTGLRLPPRPGTGVSPGR